MASQLSTGDEAFKFDGPISDRPMSNLEKVHFIVGYAIMRPGLRSVSTLASTQNIRPLPWHLAYGISRITCLEVLAIQLLCCRHSCCSSHLGSLLALLRKAMRGWGNGSVGSTLALQSEFDPSEPM